MDFKDLWIVEIATQIMLQAVDDWKRLAQTDTGFKYENGNTISIYELKSFFTSEWCKSLMQFINADYNGLVDNLNKYYPSKIGITI